jgi:hypothetical protein
MRHGIDIYIDVLDELVYAGQWKETPAAALLTGRFTESNDSRAVAVTGFTNLRYADTLEGALRTIGRHVASACEEGEPPVGLFVSHPAGEGNPPDAALRAHLSFLNLPAQSLWVLDSRTRRLGVFERPAGQPFRAAQWRLRTDSVEHDGEEDGDGDDGPDSERADRRDRGEGDPGQPRESDR